MNDLNKHTTYAIEEAKLNFYIDYFGIDRVKLIVDCVFSEKDSSTGSHFLDILDMCEREYEEEEIKKFHIKRFREGRE